MRTALIVLGSIGCGKSTISEYLMSTPDFKQFEFIGFDIYKKKYFDSDVKKDKRGYRCADELAFQRIDQVCSDGLDFLFEFCPTNRNKFRSIKSICTKYGYHIIAVFIGTNNAIINLSRCKERISRGADLVSETKIKKRYFESMSNILEIIRMSDITFFIDNSAEYPKLIAQIAQYKVYVYDRNCLWFKTNVLSKLI